MLLTSRLALRPLRLAESAAIFAYRSDPKVARFQNWNPRDEGEVRTFAENLLDTAPYTPDTWYQLTILLRDGHDLIGDCGLHFPVSKPREAEVGITVSPPHQRQGYATEALLRVMEYLFVDLGKHRVYARVHPRNQSSIPLLARVGMRKQEPLQRCECAGRDSPNDVVYAILKEEPTRAGEADRVGPPAG